MDLTTHLQSCIEWGESKLTETERCLDGMSGWQGRQLLNSICDMPNCRYLEIGVWKGSTFFSALKGNKIKAVAIDNWSEFGGPKDEFMRLLTNYTGSSDVTVINDDYFSAKFDGKFNVYFFDGCHTEEHQRLALTKMVHLMDDEFIFIVDDYNWPVVKEGTLNGVKEAGLKVVAWHELGPGEDSNPASFWNGMLFAVLRRE